MTPKCFVHAIQQHRFQHVFNPYSDWCEEHDVKNAATLRSEALYQLLKQAMENEVDAVWIGRDLGYRGGRRTGLALTDDVHIKSHADRWGIPIERATVGLPIAERTAAVIWQMLELISESIFLWNVFPFHPHEAGDPFSNRAHTAAERIVGEDILASLITLLRPRRLISIGNDAAISAARLATNQAVFKVRHPSYGGQNEFIYQISDLYGLQPQQRKLL